MHEILYTVAKDKEGNIVTAELASKPENYYCAICSNVLVLKKSGKVGPRSKRAHFAHKAIAPNCKPETALHFGFKTLVAEKLAEYLQHGSPLIFTWRCEFCAGEHVGNYTKKLKSVKLEYDFKFCKPDIALFDSNDKIFAVIEIVVTHPPTERVLNYYLQNDIILIRIDLRFDNEIYLLDEKLTKPNCVKFCTNPKCPICGNYTRKLVMTIIHGACWRCFSPMKVVAMKDGGNKFTFGPEKFNLIEIAFARENGVLINEYSKYLANCCSQCDFVVKKQYLDQNYFSYASKGKLQVQDFDVKYDCLYCANQERYLTDFKKKY